MTDLIANLVDSVPTTGLAVGGAVVAIAVTFFAVKVLGSNPDSQSTLNLPTKKKKKRSAAPKKVSKKKASTDVESAADNNIITESKEINLQDFVAVSLFILQTSSDVNNHGSTSRIGRIARKRRLLVQRRRNNVEKRKRRKLRASQVQRLILKWLEKASMDQERLVCSLLLFCKLY